MTQNPLIPSVSIDLDRPRTLRYNFGAFAAMERVSGRPFVGPLSPQTWTDLAIPRADNTLLLLYGGLYAEDPGITIAQCGELITFENAQQVDNAIAQALEPVLKRAFRSTEEPKGGDPPQATVQDGSTSGVSPVMISDSPMWNS